MTNLKEMMKELENLKAEGAKRKLLNQANRRLQEEINRLEAEYRTIENKQVLVTYERANEEVGKDALYNVLAYNLEKDEFEFALQINSRQKNG